MLAREICDEGAQLTLTAAASLLERLILGVRRSMQNAKSSRSCFARIEPMHIISPWASASRATWCATLADSALGAAAPVLYSLQAVISGHADFALCKKSLRNALFQSGILLILRCLIRSSALRVM